MNTIKKNKFSIHSVKGIINWWMEKLTQPRRTSVSDRKNYSKICFKAANDNRIFKNFKRNIKYQRVLEHVSQKQGLAYLRIILNKDRNLVKFLNNFKENDKYGNPFVYKYKVGNLSPTTLRYIKVLSDLKKIFHNLDNFVIVEIGGGYGGQCKIISNVFAFNSYTLIDLKNVLLLAKKYLSKLKVKNVQYLNPCQINKLDSCDLLISNYAFSECTRKIQDIYIDKVLRKSKRGYITYNYCDKSTDKYHPVSPYSKKEIIQILNQYHQIKIIPENPKTSPQNFIILWDDKKSWS